jgi:nucleoside-diphosphate-sugar epimerase
LKFNSKNHAIKGTRLDHENLCYNSDQMILVTGGTGFIGRSLIRVLTDSGKQVRLLLRPSAESPNLPNGIPVEVAVSSLNDFRGLRAAMKDVDVVYHLAGAERNSSQGNLSQVDVEGTKQVVTAAKEAGIKRFFFISHLGANRSSAFPMLKAKAIAEKWIMDSGVPYTIFRTNAVYGPGDQFTEPIYRLLKRTPGIFLLPGKGDALLQPLFIDDLVTCMVLALEDSKTINRTYSIGGVEFLTYREIVEAIAQKTGLRRMMVPFSFGYMRRLTLWVNQLDKNFPISVFWLDTIAENRTCTIDILPREFGILPARMNQKLDYLLS